MGGKSVLCHGTYLNKYYVIIDMATDFVTIGKITMTRQAAIIWATGWVLSIATLGVSIFFRHSFKATLAAAFMAVMIFAMFSYMAYVTNCTIVGECKVLSWVLVAFALLYAFYFVFLSFAGVAMMSYLKR
jgi:hypothetical protein